MILLFYADGGRLKTELNYMRQIETQVVEKRLQVTENDSAADLGGGEAKNFQLIIQTPINGHGSNMLNPSDLLAHVEIMLAIAEMQIHMFGA